MARSRWRGTPCASKVYGAGLRLVPPTEGGPRVEFAPSDDGRSLSTIVMVEPVEARPPMRRKPMSIDSLVAGVQICPDCSEAVTVRWRDHRAERHAR